jgi:hypothetical protein
METTPRPSSGRRRHRRLVGLLLVVAGAATIGAASFSLAIFTSSSMMPGDAVPTGVPGQAVTVSNTGTGVLRYAISGTSTDADGKHLNTQLLVTVRQPDGNAGSSCALMTGNSLFSAVVPTAGVNMVGDPTQGAQAGDRTLTAGSTETLCFKASLPLATTNAYQGTASTYTFTFNAEQTANNP